MASIRRKGGRSTYINRNGVTNNRTTSLVGHHSERKDRAYRGRAIGKIDKSVELSKVAKDLESRAESAGTGGISSDDPDAKAKLEDKLLQAEQDHAFMIERNRAAKARYQPKPFATFQLSNSRGRITQITKRIEDLERKANRTTSEPISGNGWTMIEDLQENRFMFTFPGKPADNVRALLKSHAFKWSPTRGAWVRQITGNARFAVDRAITELQKIQPQAFDSSTTN